MSILNVNKINPVGGGSTITIAGIASVTNNISVGNSVTAGSFVGPIEGNVTGDVTGNVTGDATGLSGNPSINTTGIITATTLNYTGNQNLSNRNLVINGAMNVAQRGTSSNSTGYQTVDRITTTTSGGIDNACTYAQVDVASGTTPYTNGFRKAFKITNGDQSSIATNDYVYFTYNFESQDIATSGWNYTSTSSYITLSFWVKSSVAQEFHGYLKTNDGTAQLYSFSTGSLTADTWTKVTKTIPGNSNLQFDNDNNTGLLLRIAGYMGTYRTGSLTQNQWAAYNSSIRYPDFTNTWFDTNDATLEFTGIQLEVGPVATPFEHRSFADELKRCQRYYYATSRWMGGARGSSTSRSFVTDFGMRLTGNQVSGGTYTNTATSGGDVVYVGSSATRQNSDVNANSLGASSTSSNGSLQLGVTVGYGLGSGDNGIVTGLYISGFTIDHEL